MTVYIDADACPVTRIAERVAREHNIISGRVFSSPLIRTVQTARIVAPGVSEEMDDRLIEMDIGPFEGMDLNAPTPQIIAFFGDFIHNPTSRGMEPLADVVARAGAFREALRTCGGMPWFLLTPSQ